MNAATIAAEAFPEFSSHNNVLESVELSIGGLRRLYDPQKTRSHLPNDRFLESVAATRVPVTMPAMGESEQMDLTGYEVILAEAKVLGLEAPGSGLTLPLADKRQQKIAANMANRMELLTSTTISIAEKYTPTFIGRDAEALRTEALLDAAGYVMMVVGHDGQKRKSHRDYLHHTLEVAASANAAMIAAFTPEELRQYRPATVFIAKNHDNIENLMSPKRLPNDVVDYSPAQGAYLSKRDIMGPRVADLVVDATGYIPPVNISTGKQLQLATRTTGIQIAPDGVIRATRMPYQNYVKEGIEIGGIVYQLWKPADINQNHVLEPVVFATEDEGGRYTTALVYFGSKVIKFGKPDIGGYYDGLSRINDEDSIAVALRTLPQYDTQAVIHDYNQEIARAA